MVEFFGEIVKIVRSKLNITQKQLADALNVSFATVNRWENNQVKPSNLAITQFIDFCENNFINVMDIYIEIKSGE